MKNYNEVVEAQTKMIEELQLDARQKKILKEMEAGNSVSAKLHQEYEKEWNADKIHGFDDGEPLVDNHNDHENTD